MGRFSASSEMVFSHPAEDIYEFISNPENWPKTYKGSAGIHDDLELPLRVGDTWTEIVRVGEDGFECRSTWRLITAERPRKFVFQQVDDIGAAADGSGGVEGITTISYTLSDAGNGMTLFHRSLDCELPRGVRIPDPLLVARANPAGIDGYHAAIARELDAAALEARTGATR